MRNRVLDQYENLHIWRDCGALPLTLITIRIDRKLLDPALLTLPLTNTRLLPRQFPHLESVPHVGIQRKRRPRQNVGCALKDHLAGLRVDPMHFDATARFVHYLDAALDAGREGDAQQCRHRREEQAEGRVGEHLGLSLLKRAKTRCMVWCVVLSASAEF